MSTPPVSFDEFVRHLNMDENSAGESADELDMTLESATDLIESYVGPMVAREVTEIVSTRCGSIMLRAWPVVSLTTITDPDGGEVDVETVEQFAGTLSVPYPGVSFAGGRHTVVYQAGWATVPGALKLATLIVAKHLWETQRPAGVGLSTGRFGSAGPEAVPFVSRGFALPNRAAELMAPYMQPGVS